MISSRRHRRISPEERRRQLEQWEAMPVEGRIAMIGVPIGILVSVHLIHLIPGVHDVISLEELGAAGMIMAIISFFLIQATFGKVARERLEQARAHRGPLGALGDSSVLAGSFVPSRRDVETNLVRLERIQRHDAAFSERLLGVFSRALLLRIASVGSEGERALLPYITPDALGELRLRLGEAQRVLPGPARVVDVEETESWTTLTLRQPFLVAHEGTIRRVPLTWTLRRTSAARSPAPVDLSAFACPACGSPVEVTHPDGMCTTCGTAITHGQLCWQVVGVSGMREAAPWIELRPVGGPDGSVLPPTLESPGLSAALRALGARHPEVALDQLELRAAAATSAWFDALVAGDVARVEPWCTEELAESMRYEVGRMRAARLVPAGGPARIQKVEWVRYGRDGWHEVADLRVFVELPWHLSNAEGQVVDGDPAAPREISVIARLVQPVAAQLTLDGWLLWQLADPRDFAK